MGGDPDSDLAGAVWQRREVGISFNLPEASKDRASPAAAVNMSHLLGLSFKR